MGVSIEQLFESNRDDRELCRKGAANLSTALAIKHVIDRELTLFLATTTHDIFEQVAGCDRTTVWKGTKSGMKIRNGIGFKESEFPMLVVLTGVYTSDDDVGESILLSSVIKVSDEQVHGFFLNVTEQSVLCAGLIAKLSAVVATLMDVRLPTEDDIDHFREKLKGDLNHDE